MKVKQPLWFVGALLLTAVVGYFVLDRIQFLMVAERTDGTVESLSSRNDRCGRRRARYDCTRFSADVRFDVKSEEYHLDVSAGQERGYDRPLSYARYAIGNHVPIVYDPSRIARAYRDELWDIWGAPVVAFLVQIAAFVGSFTEKKRS